MANKWIFLLYEHHKYYGNLTADWSGLALAKYRLDPVIGHCSLAKAIVPRVLISNAVQEIFIEMRSTFFFFAFVTQISNVFGPPNSSLLRLIALICLRANAPITKMRVVRDRHFHIS